MTLKANKVANVVPRQHFFSPREVLLVSLIRVCPRTNFKDVSNGRFNSRCYFEGGLLAELPRRGPVNKVCGSSKDLRLQV